LQNAHEETGLRLYALHGRDDEDNAVQDAKHPFNLGDEVGVTRRVDQVDDHVLDRERDHGRLDGDPSLSFQSEGVSLRCPLVDASYGLNDTGGVEKPLGKRGLTCVDVGEDPQVECVARQASFPSRSQGHSGWSWTFGACSLLDELVLS